MYVSGGWPFQMTGSVREPLPDVQEWLGSPPGSPGAPTGCPVVVGWFSRMSGSDQYALLDVSQLSGGPPGCLGVVGRPSRMSGSGRKSFPDVRR